MLMVFGIKSQDDSMNDFSLTSNIDQRHFKKSIMTGFQAKMQEKLGEDETKKALNKQKTKLEGKADLQQFIHEQHKTSAKDMICSYEDATAQIANANEIRDMN